MDAKAKKKGMVGRSTFDTKYSIRSFWKLAIDRKRFAKQAMNIKSFARGGIEMAQKIA